MNDVCLIVPNWNGEKYLKKCLDSIINQTTKVKIIVIDNGSSDNSLKIINSYKNIKLIKLEINTGFAGAVNLGFNYALENNYKFTVTLNNDARADEHFIENLIKLLKENKQIGIATSKIIDDNNQSLDSTGEFYTIWGLSYPRGRNEKKLTKYDNQKDIFAASGGASIYRVEMLKEIGLFDEDFFAYYEDVDLSFRAQLAGWKIKYEPKAIVYHQIGATSGKIKGFTTYQTMKNLPLLLVKNVPSKYLYKIGWRYMLSIILFFGRAIISGNGWSAIKGDFKATLLFPKALGKRKEILKNKKVSDEYIWNQLVHDLPPNAFALRRLRSKYWKMIGRS